MVSRYVKQGTNKQKLWEHGSTGQFWRETREQRPLPPRYTAVTRESKFIVCKSLPGFSAVRLEWIEIEQFASL